MVCCRDSDPSIPPRCLLRSPLLRCHSSAVPGDERTCPCRALWARLRSMVLMIAGPPLRPWHPTCLPVFPSHEIPPPPPAHFVLVSVDRRESSPDCPQKSFPGTSSGKDSSCTSKAYGEAHGENFICPTYASSAPLSHIHYIDTSNPFTPPPSPEGSALTPLSMMSCPVLSLSSQASTSPDFPVPLFSPRPLELSPRFPGSPPTSPEQSPRGSEIKARFCFLNAASDADLHGSRREAEMRLCRQR